MSTVINVSDLDSLSQEELIELANQVQDIKKANSYRKLESYLETAHDGQISFHKAPHRIRYVLSGNRGGKSTAGCVEFIWLNLGTHPFRKCKIPIKSVIVIPDFENHGKNVLMPKLIEWCPPDAIQKLEYHQNGCIKKIFWKGGSTTDVLSHSQDDSSFEGSDYDVGWFDEPPPKHIWNAVWRAMVDRGGIMYLMGTPLSSPWLYDEFQEIKNNTDPLRWYIQFTSFANAKNIGQGDEELGKKRIEDWASIYDEEERAARLGGGFIQLQGLIFKVWDRSHHIIKPFEIPHSWEITESIDPHPQKPWAVAWIAKAPNGARILLQSLKQDGDIAEIADSIILGRHQLPIRDDLTPRITQTIIDNAASVPTWQRSNTEPTARRISVREELQNYIGPKIGGPIVIVAPKNVTQKIALFKAWLTIRERNGKKRADFFVFDNPSNEEFIFEMERYRWARFSQRTRRGEMKAEPVKKDDDLLDACMQVAMTQRTENGKERPAVVDLLGGFEGYGAIRTGRSISKGPDPSSLFG